MGSGTINISEIKLRAELGKLIPVTAVDEVISKSIYTIPSSSSETKTISTSNKMIYGIGERCLLIDPFDNFKLFTLYENATSDDRKPLDLSDGQKIYMIFRSNNKEIRIPEFEDELMDFTIDKQNGQVLFKISQKNAQDILSMNTKVFYITRVYEIYNSLTEDVESYDEEVVYSGFWGDRSYETESKYTNTIKTLKEYIDNQSIVVDGLQDANLELINQNAELSVEVSELSTRNAELEATINNLKALCKSRGIEYDEINNSLIFTNMYEGKLVSDNVKLENAILGLD